jgi:hypothetical protein
MPPAMNPPIVLQSQKTSQARKYSDSLTSLFMISPFLLVLPNDQAHLPPTEWRQTLENRYAIDG